MATGLERLLNAIAGAYAMAPEAVDAWGRDAQTRMAVEEASEWLVSLMHHARGRADDATVLGECADVIIMALQVAEMMGSAGDLAEHIALKVKRTQARLDAKREGGA